jgi:hypothetical protein
LSDETAGAVWRWNSPDRPGVYSIQHDRNTIYAKAVALPPEESELELLAPSVLTGRLAKGQAAYFRNATAEGERRDDAWMWLAFACALCMIGEVGTMIGFRD